MISIELFKTQLDGMIDAVDLEMADKRRYEAVQAAVERYSNDAPRFETQDVSGDGGRYYGIAASLSKWVEDFSQVRAIQYPAKDPTDNESPIFIDEQDYTDSYFVEESGDRVRYLYLSVHAPGATEEMRITFTVPYEWEAGGTAVAVNQATHGLAVDDFIYLNSSSDWVKTPDNSAFQATAQVITAADGDNFTYKVLYVDVPQADFFAVCNLAACVACQWMAAKYAKASDTTIGADSTTHTTRTSEFASRSTEFCNAYKSHLGLDGEQVQQGAGSFVDWDTYPSLRSRSTWVFHNDVNQRGRDRRRMG